MNSILPISIASANVDRVDASDTELLRHIARFQDFCQWLRDEGDNLIAAVQLLGGPGWAKRGAGIVAHARDGGPLMASRGTIVALSKLLHGSHAGEIESFEAWPFTWLHPDDPRATNAMRCADALDCGLSAIDELRRAGLRTELDAKVAKLSKAV